MCCPSFLINRGMRIKMTILFLSKKKKKGLFFFLLEQHFLGFSSFSVLNFLLSHHIPSLTILFLSKLAVIASLT